MTDLPAYDPTPEQFATDVFGIICRRLTGRADDLGRLVGLDKDENFSYELWLNVEAVLACLEVRDQYRFWAVEHQPKYRKDEHYVADDSGKTGQVGDLQVSLGPPGRDHRWVFAEFAALHDGTARWKWPGKVRDDIAKLRQLKWRESVLLMVIVVVISGDPEADGDYLDGSTARDYPQLGRHRLELPQQTGTLLVEAFNVRHA